MALARGRGRRGAAAWRWMPVAARYPPDPGHGHTTGRVDAGFGTSHACAPGTDPSRRFAAAADPASAARHSAAGANAPAAGRGGVIARITASGDPKQAGAAAAAPWGASVGAPAIPAACAATAAPSAGHASPGRSHRSAIRATRRGHKGGDHPQPGLVRRATRQPGPASWQRICCDFGNTRRMQSAGEWQVS